MFEVIKGGASSSNQKDRDWSKVMRALLNIERCLVQRQHASMGPRQGFAMLCGLASLCAAFFVLSQAGVRQSFFISLAVAVPVFFLVLHYSKRPRTWTAKLDQLLAAYDPIDKEAYRRLQQRTREAGYLERDLVHEWLGFERHAVRVEAGWERAAPDGFLNKKV